MKNIRIVSFDIDGVLLDGEAKEKYFAEKTHKLLSKNGFNIKKSEFDSTWKGLCTVAIRKGLSITEMRRMLFRKFKIPQSLLAEYEEIDKRSLKFVRPTENCVGRLLKKLKKDGYIVAALSNTVYSSDEKGKILKLAGLGNTIDKIFAAIEIRHRKPERKAYYAVLDYFRVMPQEAIFVGHEEHEIKGAKAVGLQTISYKGYKKADFYASKFSQIPEYIKLAPQ